jgi:hypothetical protein
MTASSPGPDDKSGTFELAPRTGALFYGRRTPSRITIFDDEWEEVFSIFNLGQTDEMVLETLRAYENGLARGRVCGREGFRGDLLRMLGAQRQLEEEG